MKKEIRIQEIVVGADLVSALKNRKESIEILKVSAERIVLKLKT